MFVYIAFVLSKILHLVLVTTSCIYIRSYSYTVQSSYIMIYMYIIYISTGRRIYSALTLFKQLNYNCLMNNICICTWLVSVAILRT